MTPPPNSAAGSGGARVRVLAPAKLTLSLEVLGVRPDGYHEIRAEMVTLDLADELEFDEGASGLIVDAEPDSRGGGLAGGSGESGESGEWGKSGESGESGENLVLRALRATGRTARVHLTKRIPVGGGLGGGSADAAAVLRWAGTTDPVLALGLGSDVPFCLVGGRALVEGIGERVAPLPFEPRAFLLLVPPFGVETAAVYRAWDQGRRTGGDGGVGSNELTDAALVVEPKLAAWRDALGEVAGAEPQLAGSGSTWFVEDGPAETGSVALSALRVGKEQGRLLRAVAVPAGWDEN
jgi:4-diphosphocytidyl-2-C-methyl-D-erythritol kinase